MDDRAGKQYEVAEHVGRYGHRDGDIAATHHYRVFRPGAYIPAEYAVVAMCDSFPEALAYACEHNARRGHGA